MTLQLRIWEHGLPPGVDPLKRQEGMTDRGLRKDSVPVLLKAQEVFMLADEG